MKIIRVVNKIVILFLFFLCFSLSFALSDVKCKDIKESMSKKIIEEVIEYRDENTKHFKLEDGSYRVYSYNNPIHKLDINGKWQEIDNTLLCELYDYKTKNDEFVFSKNNNESLLRINRTNYSIQFDYCDYNFDYYEVTNGIEKNDINYDYQLYDNNSKIKYYSPKINIEYSMLYTHLITKIDINDVNVKLIKFKVILDNLYIKTIDNNIWFINKETNTSEYKLISPYIIINENEYINNKVKYNVFVPNDKEAEIELSIDISESSLIDNNGNACYSIVIPDDPGGTPVFDTYISETYPNTNYGTGTYMKVSNNNTNYALIKLNTPTIPSNATITNAYYYIPYYYSSSSSSGMYLGAYEILGSWQETSVKWNNKPSVSSSCISTVYTLDSYTASNPGYAALGITEAIRKWYSCESANNGIAIKYYGGQSSNVYLYAGESYITQTEMVVNYNTTSLIIDNDTYFIKNGHLDKYIQIDDGDSSNNYSTEGAILELWAGNGDNYQKWNFVNLYNGYYKIISKISGKAISVQSGYENSGAYALVQQTYTGSPRQQWKISLTSRGLYKIKPKSSESYSTDWVMCCGEGLNENGRNVEQRSYDNNNILKDEWLLEVLNNKNISFCGITNSGHNHSTCLETTKQNLFDEGFNNTTIYTGSITPMTCLFYLKNSSIFTSRSHGNFFESNDVVTTTGIILNDTPGSGMIGLYSHYDDRMTYCKQNIVATDNFSNLELVLFFGCFTGRGGIDGNNLPTICVAQGAEVAVGFTESISCNDANEWTIYFYNYLISGETVQEAVNQASSKYNTSTGLRSAIVCGNGDYTIE